MNFDRSLDVVAGHEVPLSALVTRVLAPNPGPFTFKGTGVYIVGSGSKVAVIDPGPLLPAHLMALERALEDRQVSHILVTHTHRDHSPAAAALKQLSGAKTYGMAQNVVLTEEDARVDEAIDRDFVPDVHVMDGQEIVGEGFTLTCVTTPGHMANHVCYGLVEEQALFTGDHVMGWSTSVIAPPDGNMGQYLASLEKLMARDDRIFYPTHGSPITNPRDWLAQLLAHRRLREAQILSELRQGGDTALGMVQKLYPDIAPGLKQAAAYQIRAHLEDLAQKGMVIGIGEHYRLKA